MRYRRLFETARDGILILSAETGRIENANPFVTELLGYTREELLGKQLWEIGVFTDAEKNQAAFRHLQRYGEIRFENLPLQSPAGAPREVEVVSSIYNEDGRQVVQCNIRDITERKRIERQLEEQAKNLAEADRLKSDFLAILSHELRNPLAAVRYALPQIDKAPLDDPARKALTVIRRQLNQIGRLVDDLLDLTRIATGKIALNREPVTLDTIINAAVDSASPALHGARHAFEVVMPAESLWVDVDSDRVSQVIGNLLMNAAKYTPRGGRITLDASRQIDQAVIRVIDNGMGIAEDHLPRLFEMFMQVNPPEKSQGGLGIGLTIAKRLVQLHGGSIEAHSGGPGRGTEFVVRLPLASAPERSRAEEREPSLFPAVRRLKVLVVDDNQDLVQMMELSIEGMGHEVRKALDGRTGISAALSYRPDVVLLDLGLPIVSGLEVARELRRHRELAHTRLVAMTGRGQEEDRRRTAAAGFDCHLTKPTNPEELEKLLAEFAAEPE
ncbi:MAG TPA: ATP-binding protein [Vicinamibacterales bacterium]|nr:ATP-binding protein [Vicinamibacterales bacterium]